MTTNINPTNIDESYPVAGQDNDSQGFRTNFTVIKNNLTFAAAEMLDLQNKVLLKSSLDGSLDAPNNDFNDTLVTRAVTKGFSGAVHDHGLVTGPEVVLFSDGPLHKIETVGATTLSFTWPQFAAIPAVDAAYLTMRIWFKITDVAHTITLPGAPVVLLGAEYIAGYDTLTRTITFGTAGDYLFEFSTASAGTGDEVFVVGVSYPGGSSSTDLTALESDVAALQGDVTTLQGEMVTVQLGELITHTVTVADNGSGAQEVFFINGVALKSQTGTLIAPPLKFNAHTRYRFDLSDPSNAGAPLRFSTTSDSAVPASITPYTTGVTVVGTVGTAGAYIEISVDDSTPNPLYMYGDETGTMIDTSLVGAEYPIEIAAACCFTGSDDASVSVTHSASLDTSSSFFTLVPQLTTPVAGILATATTGGTLLDLTPYYYRVSAIDAVGETLAFSTAGITTADSTASTNTITVNWTAVPGAIGYKVYGRTSGTELLIATVGAVTTFLDDGSITPAGALPIANTTSPTTLAAGINGQIKTLAFGTTGSTIVTVANAGWKASGSGTISFTAIGNACTLQYTNAKWYCVGNNGATFT